KPISPCRFNQQLKIEAGDIILKCLEKDVNKRFSSPMEFIESFQAASEITNEMSEIAIPKIDSGRSELINDNQHTQSQINTTNYPAQNHADEQEEIRKIDSIKRDTANIRDQYPRIFEEKPQPGWKRFWWVGAILSLLAIGLFLWTILSPKQIPIINSPKYNQTPLTAATQSISIGSQQKPTADVSALTTSGALSTSITPVTEITQSTVSEPTPEVMAIVSTVTIEPTAVSNFITMTRKKDGMIMVFVPEGTFKMGSNSFESIEKPEHTIKLSAYWIDQTEITNDMYTQCVKAKACQPPLSNDSAKRDGYYTNPNFDHYPVVNVDWNRATAYCEWIGGRLPTEAEWEKAARGTTGRLYPWGDNAPHENLINYDGIYSDTTSVGRFPAGVSPFGAFDMSGNVWEWVADWYDEIYYQGSYFENPTGPTFGTLHLLRGGSWSSDIDSIRTTYRFRNKASYTNSQIGFRCAKSG
ncbi:MAG: formylglycine-generating enzyme family protein, partial [Leptolinea sp.]|nr:formylglycine-generating enzyme family protein [Leptolinea sp.]